MAYLIDTNIAIHARDGTDAVLDKLVEHDGAVLLSALSLVELQRGIYRSPADTVIRRMRPDVLLRHIPVLPFDAAAAEIAAHAISTRIRFSGNQQRCGFSRHPEPGS